jgi:hypothetical protein
MVTTSEKAPLTRKPRSLRSRVRPVWPVSGAMRQRIQSRVVWALALFGIAGGLYAFDDKLGSRSQTSWDGPNVRSVGAAASPGCNIKGNINITTGERIYHVPGQKYYNATRVDPSRGEQWFCSEWEAWWAGWRKAKL